MNKTKLLYLVAFSLILTVSCSKNRESYSTNESIEISESNEDTNLTSLSDPFQIILRNDKAFLILTNGKKKKEFEVQIEWRYESVSENRRFLLLTTGTDVVGSLYIFDIKELKEVLTMSYEPPDPSWKGNTLDFSTVLWVGDGYSICQKVRFNNGRIERKGQFVGNYHVLSDEVEPLSIDYCGTKHSLIEILNGMKMFAEYRPMISYKTAFIYSGTDVNRKSIIEYINQLYAYLSKVKGTVEFQYYGSDVFCKAYLILETGMNERLISKNEKDEYTKKFLKLLEINNSIVPWLFE